MSERNNLSKVRLEYWPLGSQSSAFPMDPKTLSEPGGLRPNLISPHDRSLPGLLLSVGSGTLPPNAVSAVPFWAQKIAASAPFLREEGRLTSARPVPPSP